MTNFYLVNNECSSCLDKELTVKTNKSTTDKQTEVCINNVEFTNLSIRTLEDILLFLATIQNCFKKQVNLKKKIFFNVRFV